MVQSFAAAVAKWVGINSEEAYLYETAFFCNYIWSKCFLKNFVYISCSLKINKQISEIICLASKKNVKIFAFRAHAPWRKKEQKITSLTRNLPSYLFSSDHMRTQ